MVDRPAKIARGYSNIQNSTFKILRAMSSTVLRLSCPDRVGLLARLSGFFAQHGGNLVEVHQFTDPLAGWFFARMAVESGTLRCSLSELRAGFEPLARELQAEWTLRSTESRMKVVLLVSKLSHCLADLLWRWRSGELAFDVSMVISNHEDLRKLVAREGIEFRHIPVSPATKPEAFAEIGAIFRTVQPDLIVLARYMQIVPRELCEEFYGRMMNIHHSFLPSFVGANPYLRAYERGVKLIGATCHYATAELDAGPIIDQEVIRVEHFHTPEDLVRLGRDCERLALARSVRWHLGDRVLMHGNKSIVFRD
ncbi:MAG: formyltetrahydrofolate deformylase [Chthoniobacter sp.]|jgi:formyltetrahydrofolate deformylase|nr:formyltetrahydrofolate deformylase [Chthoniobacter sp.]